MPRTCTVCSHPDRAEIDAALAAGDALRNVAKRCSVTASALFRHKRDHLPGHLLKAAEEEDLAQAIDVVRQLKAINAACLEILQKSRADGKHSISLRAVDRIHKQIELQARLLGELQDAGPQVNVLVAAEWHQIRVQVFQALEPYPEARAAVAGALVNHGGA
jgi:hypothetical protein